MLVLYYVHSRSSVAALSDLTVLGSGDIYGARLVVPLPSSDPLYHSVTLGLDYKDVNQNLGQAGTPPIQSPVRYWPASVTYSGSSTGSRGRWEFSTGISMGLRGVGSGDQAFDTARFKADANFFVYKWDVQRTQSLPKSWSLVARLDGQIADQPLLSNEQFAAGGAGTVRGYLEAETIGDDALHGSLELRGPSLWSREATGTFIEPHLFVDGARLWLRSPLPGQQSQFSLSSAGLGLRVKGDPVVDAALDVAWPFETTNYTEAGHPRLLFSVAAHF
jgi:hemolysin activation/secretion protein